MVSQKEALLAWLRVVPGGESVSELEDIVRKDDVFRNVVREITGGADGSESPSEILEKWLESQGQAFVVDHGDALSIGQAALGAAVNSNQKNQYITDIMGLDKDCQVHIMELIKLFKEDVASGQQAQLRKLVAKLQSTLKDSAQSIASGTTSVSAAAAAATSIQSQDELKAANTKLKEAERKYKVMQSQVDDLEKALAEQRDEMQQAQRKADDRIAEYEEEMRAQADELDVARAKAAQLIKSEAKVNKLMQKLEESNALRDQLREMQEDSQASEFRAKEAEQEAKAAAALKQQVETWKSKTLELESQVLKLSSELRVKEEALSQSQLKVKNAQDNEKFLKDQLESSKESIAELEAQIELSGPGSPKASNVASAVEASAEVIAAKESAKIVKRELEQKIHELTQENNDLKARVEQLKENQAGGEEQQTQAMGSLNKMYKEKVEECENLEKDKQKLQKYVQTVLKTTQERYSISLKASHDTIAEQREMINNFNAIREEDEAKHKQEQQLIMSAMYEMGLEVQRRVVLKNSQSSNSWLTRTRNKAS